MLEVPMVTSVKGLLVKTVASLVSVGTEKAMIEVAQKSLLGKALARPDWVKQVIVPFGEWEKNPRLQAKTLVCLRYGELSKI